MDICKKEYEETIREVRKKREGSLVHFFKGKTRLKVRLSADDFYENSEWMQTAINKERHVCQR